MATRTITTSDLDGTTPAQTVTFSYGDTQYEIDLTEAQRVGFEAILSLYTPHARQTQAVRTQTYAKRNAEILGRYLSEPYATMGGLAKEYGITAARVSQIISDARYYGKIGSHRAV